MGILYIVATPIGNLEDITLRAVRILKEADLVLCEDTRVTKKLLDHYNITTPTFAYHQHSDQAKLEKILSQLSEGKSIALVTDAGTPGLSDPGGKLVAAALGLAGIRIEVVPGPSALVAAVSISGLAMDKFLFLGFLPHKKGRQTLLAKIVQSEYPVVLYESVHRINKLLEELRMKNEECGMKNEELKLVLCRELTKKFETVYRGTIEEVRNQLSQDKTKGEFVAIVHK